MHKKHLKNGGGTKINITSNFYKQLKDQWVIIFLTVIGIFLTVWFRWGDITQYRTPLFKYTYDSQSQSINIEPGNDFSPVTVIWLLPGAEATSTGLQKNSLTINDILDTFSSSQRKDNPNLVTWSYDGEEINKNVSGYFRCIVFNEPTVESTSTVEGLPIGVYVRYVVKGENTINDHYDLLLLRDFDFTPIQIYTFPNLSFSSLKQYLLEYGNNKLTDIIKRDPYDANQQYLTSSGACAQISNTYLQIPLH